MKTKLFFVNFLFSLIFVVACGGNNGQPGNPDAGTDSGRPPLCASVNCDDKIACTWDTCDEATGKCSHQADHALCSGGTVCMPKEGCVSPPPCANDGDCPDTDNGPCMQEYCDTASASCSWRQLDSDGDGHAPQRCVDISGDDCNDDDYSRHPGAEELCRNGVDKDCDGIIDCKYKSCSELFDCFDSCTDSDQYEQCREDCKKQASDQALQQYEQRSYCYQIHCGDRGEGCRQCEDEFAACGQAPTGMCADLGWCLWDCGGDDYYACFHNCYTSAPVDCQQCYNRSATQNNQCLRQICPNEDDTYTNCATQNCGQLPESGPMPENQYQCVEQNCGQLSDALVQCLNNPDVRGRLMACMDLLDTCFFKED